MTGCAWATRDLRVPKCTQHLKSRFCVSFRASRMMARAAFAKCLRASSPHSGGKPVPVCALWRAPVHRLVRAGSFARWISYWMQKRPRVGGVRRMRHGEDLTCSPRRPPCAPWQRRLHLQPSHSHHHSPQLWPSDCICTTALCCSATVDRCAMHDEHACSISAKVKDFATARETQHSQAGSWHHGGGTSTCTA